MNGIENTIDRKFTFYKYRNLLVNKYYELLAFSNEKVGLIVFYLEGIYINSQVHGMYI